MVKSTERTAGRKIELPDYASIFPGHRCEAPYLSDENTEERLMKCRVLILVLLLMTLNLSLQAAEQVRILALFPGKAMLSINGKNRVMTEGDVSPEGVKLISANPARAIVFHNGQEQEMGLGRSVYSTYQKPSHHEVRILRDNRGAYLTDGLINGQPVKLLVDTGATVVALSSAHARRLGIQYQLISQNITVNTAAGEIPGHGLKLDSVKVGGIEMQQVEAVVIEGTFPSEILLGMSFLNQLEIVNKGNLMLLRKKY